MTSTMVSRLELIRRVPLFSMLTTSQAVLVADAVVKQRYRKGETILEQGQKSCALTILLTGRARVVSRDARGREVILATLRPGDYVGEMSLIDQSPHYTYTDSRGTKHQLAQTSPGLNAIIAETATRYGWRAVRGVYTKAFSASTGHGYCATSYNPATNAGRWTYRLTAADEPTVFPPTLLVPVHPNAGGHAHYTNQILAAIPGCGHKCHRPGARIPHR